MSKTEQIVFEIAERIAEPMGFEIVEVEYKKEGSEYFLRVYIDRDDGYISIDDCESVSRKLSDALDKNDPVDGQYYLEVCSPGIDRILKRDKDFIRFIGSDVDVKLYAAADGIKEFTGKLIGYENRTAHVEADGKIYNIKHGKAAYIRLSVKF